MSFKVNDQLDGLIKINGQELVLTNGNFLKTLHIRAAALDALPTMHFEFVDLLKLVPSMNLNDGSTVEVTLSSNIQIVRNFRVFSWLRTPVGDGFAYSIDCYWDAPQYLMGTSCAGILGSSSSVLNTIATTCGLGISTFNQVTADQMIWLPNNRTYAIFAKDVARHGFRSATSHMVLAVDSHGTMRYWDINSNPAPAVTVGFVPPSNGGAYQRISDFTATINSGTNNMVGGYQHVRHAQSVTGSTVVNQLTLSSDSKVPTINFDVRTELARSFVTHSPLDYGNVHPNYEQAWVQNIRYNLLNSMEGQFLFNTMTNWEPLDNFNYAAPSDLNNNQHDGEYTVTTKIVFIAGKDYSEKIIAVRNGLNS